MSKKEIIIETKLVKVPTSKLAVGMYVSELDRPWLETSFTLQGFPLNSTKDIQSLRDICDFVYIDMLKSRFLPTESRQVFDEDLSQRVEYPLLSSVEKEIKQARPDYDNSLQEIHELLQRTHDGESIVVTTRRIRHCVKECVASIERNPSAMMWLTRIKHVDAYTAEHCVNVGVLAISLGRHLGLKSNMLQTLGLAGMLHDVGKMGLDQSILNKPGRLTDEEFDHIKQHTVLGEKTLSEDPLLSHQVIETALCHHERIDGRGYPQGISSKNLHLCTRIISIVDAYDAMTSTRCYSKPKSTATALKILYENTDTQFDGQLVVKFIECIGLYPPGCLLEMKSGEVGIVIASDPSARLLPRVAIILSDEKQPTHPHIIDLKEQRKLPEGPQHHIKQVLPDGAFDIDLEAFTDRFDTYVK